MEDEGWTPIYDRMFDPDHELAMGPACERWAFADLCRAGRHDGRTRVVGDVRVELGPGEFVASVRFLAHRWRWSKSRVHRFLALLCNSPINKLGTGRGTPMGQVYSITAHETYALGRSGRRDSKRDKSGTGAGQKLKKRVENTTLSDDSNEPFPDEFEDLWGDYPERRGQNPKKPAYKAWTSRLRSGATSADLATAVRHYAEHCREEKKTDTPYVMQTQTFLGPNERWKEFVRAPHKNGHQQKRRILTPDDE